MSNQHKSLLLKNTEDKAQNRRDKYLKKLINQNMGQRTGLLGQYSVVQFDVKEGGDESSPQHSISPNELILPGIIDAAFKSNMTRKSQQNQFNFPGIAGDPMRKSQFFQAKQLKSFEMPGNNPYPQNIKVHPPTHDNHLRSPSQLLQKQISKENIPNQVNKITVMNQGNSDMVNFEDFTLTQGALNQVTHQQILSQDAKHVQFVDISGAVLSKPTSFETVTQTVVHSNGTLNNSKMLIQPKTTNITNFDTMVGGVKTLDNFQNVQMSINSINSRSEEFSNQQISPRMGGCVLKVAQDGESTQLLRHNQTLSNTQKLSKRSNILNLSVPLDGGIKKLERIADQIFCDKKNQQSKFGFDINKEFFKKSTDSYKQPQVNIQNYPNHYDKGDQVQSKDIISKIGGQHQISRSVGVSQKQSPRAKMTPGNENIDNEANSIKVDSIHSPQRRSPQLGLPNIVNITKFTSESSPLDHLKHYGVSTIDGTTLMSYREEMFFTSGAKNHIRIGEQMTNLRNSYLVQSNHYKFNRIKEGGWGVKHKRGDFQDINNFQLSVNQSQNPPLTGLNINCQQNGISSDPHSYDLATSFRFYTNNFNAPTNAGVTNNKNKFNNNTVKQSEQFGQFQRKSQPLNKRIHYQNQRASFDIKNKRGIFGHNDFMGGGIKTDSRYRNALSKANKTNKYGQHKSFEKATKDHTHLKKQMLNMDSQNLINGGKSVNYEFPAKKSNQNHATDQLSISLTTNFNHLRGRQVSQQSLGTDKTKMFESQEVKVSNNPNRSPDTLNMTSQIDNQVNNTKQNILVNQCQDVKQSINQVVQGYSKNVPPIDSGVISQKLDSQTNNDTLNMTIGSNGMHIISSQLNKNQRSSDSVVSNLKDTFMSPMNRHGQDIMIQDKVQCGVQSQFNSHNITNLASMNNQTIYSASENVLKMSKTHKIGSPNFLNQLKRENQFRKFRDMEMMRERERKERESFNKQFEAMYKFNHNYIDDNIEAKQSVRKQRDTMEQQMKMLKKQIKEKKKMVDGQRKANLLVQQQLKNQVNINERLLNIESLCTYSAQMPSQSFIQEQQKLLNYIQYSPNNDKQDQMYQSSSFERDYNANTYENTRQSSVYSNNQGNQTDKNKSQELFNPSHGVSAAEHSRSTMYASNANLQKDIHGLYKFLFETDLNSAKDRTMEQLEQIKEQNDFNIREFEVIKLENENIKKLIKRYHKMIEEIQDPDRQAEFSMSKSQPNFGKILQRRMLDDSLNISMINQQLYKYGENHKARNDDTKSSFYGNMTSNTPNVGLNFNRTHMSFGGGMGMRQGMVLDIKKSEFITSNYRLIQRFNKPLDSIIAQLKIIRDVFKAQKVTLFIIDSDLQSKIFMNKKERRNNYKRILLGGQTIIYAVFNQESDFAGPVFKNINEAKSHLFNNKTIIIPMKSGQSIQMSLQVIWDEKIKVGAKATGNKNSVLYRGKGFNPRSRSKKVHNKSMESSRSFPKRSVSPGRTNNSLLSRNDNRSFERGLNRQQSTISSSQKSLKLATAYPQVSQGFSQNDYNVIRILASYIHMSVDYFQYQVLKRAKEKKVREIVEFSLDIMSIKSYRQLVKKVKVYCSSMMGFSDCSLFFKNQTNGDLFTVADLDTNEKKRPGVIDTSFAKELCFPDDQIVIFPSTIGVTGEVHAKMGIKFQNNFGQLTTKAEQQEDMNDGTVSDTVYRRSSLRTYQKQQIQTQIKTPYGMNRVVKTNLEQIIEDAPQAENEVLHQMNIDSQKNSQISRPGSRGATSSLKNHFTSFNLNQEDLVKNKKLDIQSTISSPVSKQINSNINQSREKISGSQTNKNQYKKQQTMDASLSSYMHDVDNIGLNDYQKKAAKGSDRPPRKDIVLAEADKISGNIMDLQNQPAMRGRKSERILAKSRDVGGKYKAEAEKYTADFFDDIDNFVGVKKIENYVISSIKDDAYNFGEESVGILQLYNKTANSKIDKEDLARLTQISKFIGALSIKAQCITSSLTLIIGLTQNVHFTDRVISVLDSEPGMDPFQQVSLPIDIIMKTVSQELQFNGERPPPNNDEELEH